MSLLDRLLRRPVRPTGVELAADEHVVASAEVTGGGWVVVTSHGVWTTEPEPRRVGWHRLIKVAWGEGALTVTEADATEAGPVELLAARPPRRYRLAEPGKVPPAIQRRVEESIRSRHHEALTGGGAWFVWRKVPGRDGLVVQAWPDSGTDEHVVREAIERLGL